MRFKNYIKESKFYYHGTNVEFDKFDARFIGNTTDEGYLGKGFYFSTDFNIGRDNKYTIKVSLRIKKPFILKMPTWTSNKRKLIQDALGLDSYSPELVTKTLIKRGYDSVILDYSPVNYKHKEVVVFKENQIKIVGKNGT